MLNIKGVEPNTQTQITVITYGEYADYVVVNKKELQDITLGRLTPVSVYICKKGELEQRQAEMIGINMKKLEERLEKDKKRLQNELEDLKSKNDYLNFRYSQIKDSLDIISKRIDNAFERIKEYDQTMTLENLDDRDENYVKAYNCFSRGEFDRVFHYLPEYELDLKYQKVLQLQTDAQKKIELAKILNESAQADVEYSKNSLNELLKEWLLLARTYNMKNDYEKTMMYYEKIINADTLNMDIMKEYALYLKKISKFSKAEEYFMRCLEICKLLEKENTEINLSNRATILYNLGNLHVNTNEPDKAFLEFEELLKIYRKLVADNPKIDLFQLANILNSFGIFHYYNNEFPAALLKYEEALKIYREFTIENPEKTLSENQLLEMSGMLNNLGNVYTHLNNKNADYSKAEQYLTETVEIRRKLAAENTKY
jgi:Tfp pilus assembly protein PilF